MNDTTEKLKEYIRRKNLRWTSQRQVIAETLLESGQHLTTEALFRAVKKKEPAVGYATVSRTLHLLTEAGICEKIDFSDGSMRYEVVLGREHHDHLICTRCGKFIEIYCPELERVQAELVRQYDFTEESHKLQIFGVCADCGGNTPSH